MSCTFCSQVGQLAENIALIADKLANACLLGDANEALSRRIARSREDGQPWARRVCAVLTWGFNLPVRRVNKRDHCTWALQPGSISREIWHWSPISPETQKIILLPVPHDPDAETKA